MNKPIPSSQEIADGESVRDRIMTRLLERRNEFVSGEDLSAAAGVSRTAVWKHIHVMEQWGFVFDSSPKKGYRMTTVPDLLVGPLLKPRLPQSCVLGRHVVFLPETASTNAVAMELAASGAADGTLVTAWEQTGGRGRRGHAWSSPRGGLWMSLVLQHALPLARAAELTLLASVAVRRAVKDAWGLTADIKWPNDLLIAGRKVCGILAEIRADGESVQHAVLGIGINSAIEADAFPDELAAIATSLQAVAGRSVPNLTLASAILRELEPMYLDLCRGGSGFLAVAEEWRSASITLGRHIAVRTANRTHTGTAVRMDDSGALHLLVDGGETIVIHSGDVLF
ncbi:biotin--[acetyl-CoA-carboxylase] ligase [Alicyclobacillus sp. ALC3]|uniref:biotin--[acetyl-CoA-carboxylase] ligase n=1 Tax=Alicyclobacillus sp. ALC3 TaxID=2796143 RepID=UPI0023782860|nr:biotin--[acetyl-CoA-carboxylase] ligase [Alicyclobacillus sp. ALC3]WDL97225.1 biotin--[acetyl-CoA-carboxylase] ligase [Alicyclobacillus sp. ALC3]